MSDATTAAATTTDAPVVVPSEAQETTATTTTTATTEDKEESIAAAAEDAVAEVTQSLEEILALGQGLDDEDYKAELDVLQNDPSSNLYSAVTFEELNLYVCMCLCALYVGLCTVFVWQHWWRIDGLTCFASPRFLCTCVRNMLERMRHGHCADVYAMGL